MLLSNILLFLGVNTHTEKDIEFFNIVNDTRHIKPGDLFLAYKGLNVDSRDKITQALSQGAVAILYDSFPIKENLPIQDNIIPVPNLSKLLSKIAGYFYNYPTKDLFVTGITGTNGKTTIAYCLSQAYELLGSKSRYIGTLGAGSYNNLQELNNTTPDPILLQKLLKDYLIEQVNTVAMEVSSHALAQGRVSDVDFKQAIYTNLSLDHLDYHKNMQDYAKAKSILFGFKNLETVILNADDKYSDIMSQAQISGKRLYYSLKDNTCDVFATINKIDKTGTEFAVKSYWGDCIIKSQFLGEFNVYNLLALFTSIMSRDKYKLEEVLEVISKLQPAPGRMEIVKLNPCVIVDYAHTPDALENVLITLNKLKTHKLCVVFGCGGDRDKTKRPIMGSIAAKYADFIILTDDNPRHEESLNILHEIAQGIDDKGKICIISDRKSAILESLNWASQDDIILIAGKGHETYQQIDDIKRPFSDKNIVIQTI